MSGEPWGDIASIDNVLLSGSDLAVAVDIGYILTQVNSALEPLRTFNQSIPVEAYSPFTTSAYTRPPYSGCRTGLTGCSRSG